MNKNLSKSFSKILLVGAVATLGFACGKEEAAPKKDVLHLYSWAEYIPTEIFADFEKETGIKVIEDIYSTNEEMFTKLKAGAKGYDLVMPSLDYVEIMMKEDMLAKIDKTKLSTFKNLDTEIMEKTRVVDENNEYSIPYALSATLIIVNEKYVKDYPKDYSIFENPKYKGRMSLLDDMREVMLAAMGTHGYSYDVNDEESFKVIKNQILDWKENLAKFDSESFGKNFASENFWVVQGYGENVYLELTEEQKKHTKFIVPETGGSYSLDSFVLLNTAPNKEAAHKFLDYLHRPEVYVKVADYLVLPSINIPARDLMTETPLFKIEDLKNAQILRDSTATLPIQNKTWEEIKGGF